jgi:hypothetical protein
LIVRDFTISIADSTRLNPDAEGWFLPSDDCCARVEGYVKSSGNIAYASTTFDRSTSSGIEGTGAAGDGGAAPVSAFDIDWREGCEPAAIAEEILASNARRFFMPSISARRLSSSSCSVCGEKAKGSASG